MTDTCESEDDCTQIPWCKIRGACQVAMEHEPPRTLADLKAGDEVVTANGWYNTHYKIRTVQRITPTQIVLSEYDRFKRNGGTKIGSGSTRLTFDPAHRDLAVQQAALESKRIQKAQEAKNIRETTELRQRAALERVKRWLEMRKVCPTVEEVIHSFSDGTELTDTDLIEVMKMARGI